MSRIRTKLVPVFFIIISILLIQGCATTRPRNAVPIDFIGEVTIADMPNIRSNIDDPNPTVMEKSLSDSFREEDEFDYPTNAQGIKIYPVLAVSAGGPDGAYGAGFLKGWSEEGSRPQIYILCTDHMSPMRQQVKNSLVGIGLRSLETLQAAALSGDIYRLFAFAQKRNLDFNLAYIPDDFKSDPKEFFDQGEMQRLFRRGYNDAIAGYKWHKSPPGLVVEEKYE